MTVKFIGSICVLIGCAMLGIKADMNLHEHVRFLYGFIAALETIESEISCRLSPIPAALRAARETAGFHPGRCVAFFGRCLDELETRGAHEFAGIWRSSVREVLAFLPEEERQLISGLADTLGNYGAEEQVSALSYIKRRLELFLQAAEKEKDRSGKVYITLGLTLGIAVVIVLI